MWDTTHLLDIAWQLDYVRLTKEEEGRGTFRVQFPPLYICTLKSLYFEVCVCYYLKLVFIGGSNCGTG